MVKEEFPVEPVTDNIVNTFKVEYFMNQWFKFWARAKYLKEADHYSNRINPEKGWRFAIGFQLTLAAGVNL